MPTYTLALMKEINRESGAEVFSGIDKNGKVKQKKRKKPYTCIWYPVECDGAYCEDLGDARYCREYVEEETW